MDGAPIGIEASTGNPRNLELFALITNGPLAAPAQPVSNTGQTASKFVSPRDDIRYQLAEYLAKAESNITKFGIPTAIVISLAWVIFAVRRRRLDAGLVIVFSLVAAVGTRVLLLGFLDATSIPSNNMLYLSPAIPMALAIIPTVLFGIIAFGRK